MPKNKREILEKFQGRTHKNIMMNRRASLALSVALLLGLAAGCHKKTPPPPPPPPTPAPAPANKPVINYFNAEPTTVTAGQPSSLSWSVSDATNVQIDNQIGSVSPAGRRGVYPTATTTYHLTATGPGGTAEGDATVTVSTPPPPQPVQATPSQSVQEILARQVQDIHFEYDKSDIRAEDQTVLQGDASALKTIFQMDANFVVTIEGHCDERGSAEYNLALGDRRAAATKDALIALGVPGEKLKTVSFGKERPLCTDATEDCYGRNRRAHFSAAQ
jgi:peptidoglycan-associated lipoprotein